MIAKSTILSPFERLPYFTTAGFRQIAGERMVDDAHARTALYRWVKAGHLIPLKKGFYMHRRFFERYRQDPGFAPMVSAILLPQSYVSLEYVLQSHGILTEVTYPVTAITLKNTRSIVNPVGTFVYKHIQPDLYWGYQITYAHGVPCAEASVSKALFDFLYLRTLPTDLAPQHVDLAEQLRLNLDEFTQAERKAFADHVRRSESVRKGGAKMRRILGNLEAHIWRR